MNSKELIVVEFNKIIEEIKKNSEDIKRLAIGEAWKILQVAAASLIQIIEKIGTDLKSPEKKQIAIDLLSDFYDNVFLVIDIPVVPNFFEPSIHRYVKGFLMVLLSASIDALVTTFRQTGIFIKKAVAENPYNPKVMQVHIP